MSDPAIPAPITADSLWAALAPTRIQRHRPDFRFDPTFYAETYPDLAAAGLDPEAHYTAHGKAEGRLGNTYAKLRLSLPDLDNRLTPLAFEGQLRTALAAGLPEIHALLFELMLLGDPLDHAVSHFSERFYLARYPDLAKADMPPLLHYIQHGIPEQRASLRALRDNQHPGQQPFDPDRPTLLIGLHEFSKTGAPIVGLDLAHAAALTHNVIVAALRPGPLLEAFLPHATCVLVTDNPDADAAFLTHPALARIDMALLNSVECFPFLPFLLRRGIPWASYIHEYTEYSRPYFKCVFMALYSDLLVFSSQQVRTSWAHLLQDIRFDTARDSCVIAQYPFHVTSPAPAQITAARQRLAGLIGLDLTGRRVVVGAGQAHWRKGTDLFIMTAQIARAAGDDSVFVWIGDGLNHEDVQFGVWLDKHMRAALANQPGSSLHFLPAGPYYKDVLRAADVFYLPSRLDPLPNVVFDAAKSGCQVVLFAQGSGFDDPAYTAAPSLHRVEYGNLAAAHDMIRTVPLKQPGPAQTASRTADPVLPRILQALTERLQAQRVFVAGGGAYDVPFLFPSHPETASARAAERDKMWTYDRPHIWPSFDAVKATIAASEHWVHKHLRVDRFATLQTRPDHRVQVHIHAHYLDDLGGDLLYYKTLRAADRVVVTTDTARKADQIHLIAQASGVPLEVHVMPNVGRDILPFMRLFSEGHAGTDPDEVWCHIHLKKSVLTSAAGDVWKRFLLAILLGDNTDLSDAAARAAAPGIGLVAPLDPYRFGWLENRNLLTRLAHLFPKPPPDQPLLFPIGNMFWTRARVVQRMNALFGHDYPWPNEPLPNDGTEFHLIERLWPTVAALEGLDALFLEKADQPRG
jgi:glycosyltransferase involved in cell wall biosynthesis